LQAIVAQQVSNQSAAAIWRRLSAIDGALDPHRSLGLADARLLGAGLSRPKLAHMRALAHAFLDGRLSAEALAAMDDRSAVATLTSVRGLGHWTAEVYLLFALQRDDVFPAGDVALAGALAHLRGLAARPRPAQLRAMAELWQPYRALAARLLWHHWRHVTGRPALDDIAAGPASQRS
jgi:DNA-3-methyladenine glycosylase II